MFQKVLIANRGEIALRIHRACKELGIRTVAAHSVVDTDSMPVRLADESVCIGPAPSRNSYLNMQALLSAATITGAEAIHPGVGFLAENEVFARMVEEHGLVFIGPKAEHIALMGNKISAKKVAHELGLPLVPGTKDAIVDDEEAVHVAQEIGFPVLVKAVAGGGGKGMKLAKDVKGIREALQLARSEAKSNFGCSDVYLEKYLQHPRHIEVQILADSYGNVLHLGERDCSIQRRHQKIWEESPSPALTLERRQKIGKVAVEAMKKLGYQGVGTLEFLYEEGKFYFIEMNTRLQVEHPITEMITGIDLVQQQIRVAAREKLSFSQEDVHFKGHAIECRINAEHPETFVPSPGHILAYHAPGGLGVRVDSHLYAGYIMPSHYDSLAGKLIIYEETRQACLAKLQRAIDEYVITGIDTLLPLHKRLAMEEAIKKGDYTIHWLESWLQT